MTRSGRSGLQRWCIAVFAAVGLLPSVVGGHESLDSNIAALTGQIAAAPAEADKHLQRGELYRLHGDWVEAEADFRRAAEIDAEAAQLDLRLGRLYLDAGRDDAARDALMRFVDTHPDHDGGWVALGQALARRGDHAAAVAAFDRGITVRSPPEVLLARARAARRAGRIEAALAGLDAALTQRGPLIVLELEAIELELAAGNTDAALRRIDRIAARMPRRETWLARRGAVLEQAGRLAEAHAVYADTLTALDMLSPAQRSTRAMRDLHRDVAAALNRLSDRRLSETAGR